MLLSAASSARSARRATSVRRLSGRFQHPGLRALVLVLVPALVSTTFPVTLFAGGRERGPAAGLTQRFETWHASRHVTPSLPLPPPLSVAPSSAVYVEPQGMVAHESLPGTLEIAPTSETSPATTSSIVSNFNGTSIGAGSTIWFIFVRRTQAR